MVAMKVLFWQFSLPPGQASPFFGCRCARLGSAPAPCVHATLHTPVIHPYSGCTPVVCRVACTQGAGTLCLAKASGPGPMAQDLSEDYSSFGKRSKRARPIASQLTFRDGPMAHPSGWLRGMGPSRAWREGITPPSRPPSACGFHLKYRIMRYIVL